MLLSLIPILIVGYIIYDAFYPDESFYKSDYKEVTGIDFPNNGTIKYKTASFPDQFGDYTSSFLVKLDYINIQKLESNLRKNGFLKKENIMHSDELEFIESKLENKAYSAEYCKEQEGGIYYSVGFLNDKKSAIITRASW
jgi:uncharacterized protein YutD